TLDGVPVTGCADQPDGVERVVVLRGENQDVEEGDWKTVVGRLRVIEHPARVVNGVRVAWQWKRGKRKTDRDDAIKLARLAAVGQIDPVAVPPHAVRQWKSLIGLRKRLVGERVRGQNRIRGLLVCQGLPAPVGARAWTERGLAGIARLARPLAGCGPEELWRGELHVLLERLRVLEAQTREVHAN